jgi:hypothetical protein
MRFGWLFRRTALALIVAGALAFPGVANAARIATLFNSGVNSADVVLADNATDLHYASVPPLAPYDELDVPAGNTSGGSTFEGPGVVTRASGGFPIPPWVADTTASAWITPAGDSTGAGGNYFWETVFDLSGYDASTAVINGRWSSDNNGLDILVNGTPTGQTNPGQFAAYSGFTIPANLLLPTTNVLTFVVNNGAGEANEVGPTGVRVEFDQREADVIPEPATLSLLFAGGAAGLLRRRR